VSDVQTIKPWQLHMGPLPFEKSTPNSLTFHTLTVRTINELDWDLHGHSPEATIKAHDSTCSMQQPPPIIKMANSYLPLLVLVLVALILTPEGLAESDSDFYKPPYKSPPYKPPVYKPPVYKPKPPVYKPKPPVYKPKPKPYKKPPYGKYPPVEENGHF